MNTKQTKQTKQTNRILSDKEILPNKQTLLVCLVSLSIYQTNKLTFLRL